MLVIVEQHEVSGLDRRIGREQQRNVDLAALQGRHGQWSTRIEGLEFFDLHPVLVLKAQEAERSLWAFRRTAEHELIVKTRQVAHFPQVVAIGARFRYDK